MPRTATARAISDEIAEFDEIVAKNTAVAKASAAIMMIDRDLTITYVNQATTDLLGANAELFQKTYPGLDVSKLIGTCIDVFHKNPAHQRRMLSQPTERAHKAEITIGDLRFGLSISSIIDAGGEYVGSVLNTLGYTLAEIKGQHHSLFVDPAYRQSPDYKAFWEKLGRGEFDAGEYKRITKDGREVWIQASYNPILDANGRAMSVVKYATDITQAKTRNADFASQVAAIDKSQAVIEFDMDGKILNANANFLATVGYGLEEIRGQQHAMFVDSEYRQSPEYKAFWDKLRRGEYDAGKYQRVGKGGREVWLQASYNPILDLNGKPCKVVKYATDLTEVAEQRKAAMRVKEVAEIVSSAATEIRATAESMAKTAQDASLQAASVTSAAQLASTNVQTVSAAGEELSASISEIARQVAESTNITQQAVAETDRTSAAIQSLADAAQKIGNVVTLINNIAGQTKLLALNATIEAARAGDAGKGFAVVASEVKSLSDQTAKATHEISSEVSAMQAATATSVTAINGIAETIGKVAEIASAIASAVEEQSAATGEISANVVQAAESTREVTTNIEQLSEGVAQTGQAAGELLTASDELAGQAETLTAQVDTLLK
jgi:methyl-accepting chemotaxis protein